MAERLNSEFVKAQELPVQAGETYSIPDYDIDAFLIEAELLLDWYLPSRGAVVSSATRAASPAGCASAA